MQKFLLATLLALNASGLSSLRQRLPDSAALADRKMDLQDGLKYRAEDYAEEGFSESQMEVSRRLRKRLGDYVYTRDPFSTTPFFEYFDSFVLGLELESFYADSTNCIDNMVYFIDDWTYLLNNATYRDVWYDPIVNFTGIISGNLSDASTNCYEFGLQVETGFTSMGTNFATVGDYLYSFMFNLMAHASSFFDIVEEIESDRKQQYYPDIAFQIGKMIKLILDVEPTSVEALAAVIPGVETTVAQQYLDSWKV